MRIAFQTAGILNAIPVGAPASLRNGNGSKTDTERRIKLLNYLEENCVNVETISYISVKLRHELETFTKTGKKEFHIYHCKGVFGFLYVAEAMSFFKIGQAYYQAKDIDITHPWAIRMETKPNSDNIKETCGNATIDKDNRILFIG